MKNIYDRIGLIVLGTILILLISTTTPVLSISNIETKEQIDIYTPKSIDAEFNPFTEGWLYRKNITVDHNNIMDDFSNYPLLINIVDNDLKDKAQSNGNDILFMDNTGIATQLYHEIEYFDDSSGELIAWVNIPMLSSSADTNICMYYGNPSSPSQEQPELVWNAGFEAVFHMDDYTTSTIKDSTVNAYAGDKKSVNHPLETPGGKIGYAQDFESSNLDNIIIYDGVYECAEDEDMTIGLWLKMETVQGFSLSCDNDYDSYYLIHNKANGSLRCSFFSMYPYTIINPTDTAPGETDVWYWIVGTLDRTLGDATIYINGEEKAIMNIGGLGGLDGLSDLKIGSSYYSVLDTFTDGIIDEVRISNIARNSEWIETSYLNQNDPSSFISIGAEETLELKSTIMIGQIESLNTDSDFITFNALNIRAIQFSPFAFIPFDSGEYIIISSEYKGVITPKFIFAITNSNI